MTAPVNSGRGGGDQISNQGVGLLPANWYRGYSSSLADAVHEGRKEQGIKMPWERGPMSVVFGLSKEGHPTFKYPRLIIPLGRELIAKIPRHLQERDPLWRAEVWPQEKEHSGTPPHAFEIKPANCTAAGCAGRRGHAN